MPIEQAYTQVDQLVEKFKALTPFTAYRWFIEYGDRLGSKWVNDVTRARPKTAAPWHPGLAAGHISCPSLFVVSPEDECLAPCPWWRARLTTR